MEQPRQVEQLEYTGETNGTSSAIAIFELSYIAIFELSQETSL